MQVDFLIIGAGMAGLSLCARLAGQASVAVVDKLSWQELSAQISPRAMSSPVTDGGAAKSLSDLSRYFLAHHNFSQPRASLYAGALGQEGLLRQWQRRLLYLGEQAQDISLEQVAVLAPALRVENLAGALLLESSLEMNVLAMRDWLIAQTRAKGAHIVCGAATKQAYFQAGKWTVKLENGQVIHANVLINAAGVQANHVAEQCGVAPQNLIFSERLCFLFNIDPAEEQAFQPAVLGVDGCYAFRFVQDQLYLHSAYGAAQNSTTQQQVQQMAQIELAYSTFQLESTSFIRLRSPVCTWSERTCDSQDGQCVMGWEPGIRPFFWFTAFGRTAVQSLPSASELASGLLLRQPLSGELTQVSLPSMQPGRRQVSQGDWRV